MQENRYKCDSTRVAEVWKHRRKCNFRLGTKENSSDTSKKERTRP